MNMAILIVGGIIVLIVSYKLVLKFIELRKDEEYYIKNTLKRIIRREYETSEEAKDGLQELNNFVKRTNSQRFPEYVEEKTKELEQKIIELNNKEYLEQRRQERLEEIEEEKEQQTKQLIDYFRKVRSNKAIPKQALKYHQEAIKNAIKQYEEIVQEQEELEELWKEIAEFIQEHKAYPANYSQLPFKEKQLYDKALKLQSQGKLQLVTKTEAEPINDEDEELLSKKYYSADELEPEERELLIKKYGYKFKPFIYRDGTTGNNLIIKNDNPSESDYHFCMKHLIAEIDEANSHIEYQKGNLRADIAFIYPDGKLAVEIETGTNKDIQIKQKVDWLNKNFDQWIIICSRQLKAKYKQYTNNKTSYCLTLKQAEQQINEIISNY